jgi:hypothetical protein
MGVKLVIFFREVLNHSINVRSLTATVFGAETVQSQ